MATELTASTPERILQVATELFYERGYHGTTTRAVAAKVGIQAGSLYSHFESKQEMLYRIAQATMEDSVRGGTEALAGLTDPEERLRALVEWHVRFHALSPFRTKVTDEQLNALDSERRSEVVALRDEIERLHRGVLDEGVRTAGWKIADPSVVTFAIVTMCTAVGTWFRPDGRLTADQVARSYADLVAAAVNGLD